MYSKGHFVTSIVASMLFILHFGITASIPLTAIVLFIGGVIGVVIDFDHFLVSYLNTGKSNLWKVVKNPKLAFIEQGKIFQDGEDVTQNQRLISHTVLLLMALGLTKSLGVIAVFVVWIWTVHILFDLLSDEGIV